MIRSYLPALVFVGLGTFLGADLRGHQLVHRPRSPGSARPRADPYECGLPSEVQKNFRFGISFYLVAMLFILFDIEVIFLFPVAIQLQAFGTFALVETIVFIVAADGRLHLRVAARSPRMEIKRERLGSGADGEFRARQLRARDMLRGDLEGPELEQHVEESILTTTLDKARQLGAPATRCSPPPSGSPAARSR